MYRFGMKVLLCWIGILVVSSASVATWIDEFDGVKLGEDWITTPALWLL